VLADANLAGGEDSERLLPIPPAWLGSPYTSPSGKAAYWEVGRPATVKTDRGFNPRRRDLLQAVQGSGSPIRPIQEIKEEVERICGGRPQKPKLTQRPVAVVRWVDGTVLHTVWQLA
jgi:hypothetical protein